MVYRGVDERTSHTSQQTTLTIATVKALINHTQPISGFVSERVDFDPEGSGRLNVGLRSCCSHCRRLCYITSNTSDPEIPLTRPKHFLETSIERMPQPFHFDYDAKRFMHCRN